jgi:hypothetical protein
MEVIIKTTTLESMVGRPVKVKAAIVGEKKSLVSKFGNGGVIDIAQAHRDAAKALCRAHKITGRFVSGQLDNRDGMHIAVVEEWWLL